jgi:urate oxidase
MVVIYSVVITEGDNDVLATYNFSEFYDALSLFNKIKEVYLKITYEEEKDITREVKAEVSDPSIIERVYQLGENHTIGILKPKLLE